MTLTLPELRGLRHAYHDLPTGVRVHVAEAGHPAATGAALLGSRAPERFTRVMLLSIVRPWTSRHTALKIDLPRAWFG